MTRHRFRYKEGMHYNVGPGALAERPRLAALVAQCAAMWSEIELQMSLTLGAILHASGAGAVAVFLSLRNARAQRDALSAAAHATLSGEALAAFDALLVVHKSLDGERNDLVHGLYGTSNDMPEVVLWIAQDVCANWLISVYEAEYRGGYKEHPHIGLRANLFYYREKDLEETLSRLTELQRAAFLMHGYLQPRDPKPSDELLRELCSLPQIREALDRNGPKSESEAQP